MYTIPVADSFAVAIDTFNAEDWYVYLLDFANSSRKSFGILGSDGAIVSAKYDSTKRQIWLVIDTSVFAIIVDDEEMYEVPLPSDDLQAYDLVQIGQEWLICGANSTIWKCSPPDVRWTAVMLPDQPPQDVDDEETQSRLNTAYAEKYPPLYAAFSDAEAAYFCGALGTLVRYRGSELNTFSLNTASRLVRGHMEGPNITLSSDNPTAEIFIGDPDKGFELIFDDGNRAMHRTALHKGRRFIGIAEYPPTRAHNIYTYEDGDLVPHMTGCAFEPSPLTALVSTGEVLWAIDAHDIYRRDHTGWSLVQGDDLRAGIWPPKG